jgi:hypothetical protein
MAEATDESVLKALVKGGSVCPACGEKPSRIVSRYPKVATVACAEGDQWEVETEDEEE